MDCKSNQIVLSGLPTKHGGLIDTAFTSATIQKHSIKTGYANSVHEHNENSIIQKKISRA